MKRPTYKESGFCRTLATSCSRRTTGLLLAVWLVIAAATPAQASFFGFIDEYRNGTGTIEGLTGAESIAISPDGAHIYAGGVTDNAVAVFSRDAATGTLTFVHAVFNSAVGVDGLGDVRAVAVSPDGAHVYAAGFSDDAVVVFSRDAATGMLTFVEVQTNGLGGVTTLNQANGLTVSPDGAHVYVASAGPGAVTVFERDAATGRLTLVEAHVDETGGITTLGGAETVIISPDGAHVYVAAQDDHAVTGFSRDAATGMLSIVMVQKDGVAGTDGLKEVQGLSITADGAHVYTISHRDDALVAFERDATTGMLSFVDVYWDGIDGVDGLDGGEWVAVSPDGAFVYSVSDVESKLGIFRRDPATGELTYLEIHGDGTGVVDGLGGVSAAVPSPDNAHVYTISKNDNAVAAFGTLCGNGTIDAGEACDDGNVVDGDCCSSTCTVEPAGTICTDDGNECTDDKCNGVGLCLHVNNTAPCDDGLWCTLNDVCEDRVCVGVARDCSGAADQCNDGVCDDDVDACVADPKADSTACDDGALCTQTDMCLTGVCVGTDPIICAALDQCHDAGVCDPATGECSDPAKADGAGCDDGNACTQSDTCVAGVCTGTDPVICAALDQCHDAGTCDPGTGECSDPAKADGMGCDDGNGCTQSDTCVAGACTGADPVVCTALDQCHDAGVCDPGTGACSDPAKTDGTACDDGSACTRSDSCAAGVCTGADPVVCTALDQCHDAGTCDPGTGVCSDPAKADGASCDDGNGCTVDDACQAGVCVSGAPLVCTALDQCHDVGVCDPATGVCSNPAKPDAATLIFEAEADTRTDEDMPAVNFGAESDLRLDGRPLRLVYLRFNVSGLGGRAIERALVRLQVASESNAGSSAGGDIHAVTDNAWDELTLTHDSRPAIESPVLSSLGAIDPDEIVDFDVTGAVASDGTYSFAVAPGSNNMAIYHAREAAVGRPQLMLFLGTPCDDGNACTQSDTCDAGVCVGTDPVVCTALDQCHDIGVCDPGTGVCSDPAKTDGTGCDDGNACTQSDTCDAGVCAGADPVICAALDQCHDIGVCDPGTGVCSHPAKTDGTGCDDGNACTQSDTCDAGVCTGADPVICAALDQCHDIGVCDPGTGVCSDPAKTDGAGCDDGNACTQRDTCAAGSCIGSNPVVCSAVDQCHDVGVCDPGTGVCSDPAKADGMSCDDGNACTRSDTCLAGVCTGVDSVVCTALDQCHVAGTCDPTTGTCSNPAAADGTSCDDENACTQTDACAAGRCVGGNPVECGAADQCHAVGTCNPATGACSDPLLPDGTACDDRDACSADDICFEGECFGELVPDADGDGFCDAIDVCPSVPDAAQLDANGDGIGDFCECTAPKPGRCIAGGGSRRTDCLLEVTTTGPISFNRRGTKVKRTLFCDDGDLSCDLDGARDGQCTFGIALCFGNADPRYPQCAPEMIESVDVMRPNARSNAANAQELEGALTTLGVEVRRRGRLVADAVSPASTNQCSPLVRLVTPAPKVRGARVVRQKFQLRARATGGRRDTDRFILVCR